MQVTESTRFCAEHRHSWLQTQQEGRARGNVHSVHRHLPHFSHSSTCFFSTGKAATAFTFWALELTTLGCSAPRVLPWPLPAIYGSTTGEGAAWSSSRWSEEVLLLLLMELGRPLNEIQGCVVASGTSQRDRWGWCGAPSRTSCPLVVALWLGGCCEITAGVSM